MNGREEMVESAETPYDIGRKGITFKDKVTDMLKTEITSYNFKEMERENRNLGLNIDNTIQFIENEFLDIEKKIEHELTVARKVGFSRDSPFRRATDEYKKWVGMFKTNSNLRNLMFELLLGEREKVYNLLARFSKLDKEIAKLQAESEVMEKKRGEYEQMKNTLSSLVDEQKKLSSMLSQVVQPSLPDELLDSLKELKSSIEKMNERNQNEHAGIPKIFEQPVRPTFKPMSNIIDSDDEESEDEEDEDREEEPKAKKIYTENEAYYKVKNYLSASKSGHYLYAMDSWAKRMRNPEFVKKIMEETDLSESDIKIGWEKVKKEYRLD